MKALGDAPDDVEVCCLDEMPQQPSRTLNEHDTVSYGGAPHLPKVVFRRVCDYVTVITNVCFGLGVSTDPPAMKCCRDFAGG